ncbi:MAG: hypothetical protein M3021_13190 [Actinomycetota bacterium]|nr:hypothetical protein [Actinomycetota bacterium]
MEGGEQSPQLIELRTEGLQAQIDIVPWIDEVVEAHGYGPRSMYVETCWLPVLGPTATWIYRRLGSWVEANPDGLEIDLVDLSVSLGLGEGLGRHSLLAKSLGRLARFGAVDWRGEDLAVRRALAPLQERNAQRLSYSARRLHEEFTRQRDRTPGELIR